MIIKDNTIGEILESERDMVIHGAELYGEYFINASELNDLLINFIKSVDDIEKYIFLSFLSQIRKHHTLSLFSATRRHHIQAGMNLRQVIEATAWAAYSMGNPEEEKFYEMDKNNVMQTPKKLGKAKNDWLQKNYMSKSNELKGLKEILNESIAHSNVAYTHQNFKTSKGKVPKFLLSFFDEENEFKEKTDLWFIGNTAIGILDLFYGVNKDYRTFTPVDDFLPRFRGLVDQNNRLKAEMMQHPRFRKAPFTQSK